MSSSSITPPPHTSQHTTEAFTTTEYKQFSLILRAIPIYHPLNYPFLAPSRMHSKDAILWMMTSWNTAHFKSSDTSEKSFTRPVYDISYGVEKCVDNEGDFVDKQSWTVNDVHIICKFHCNGNHSFWKKYRRHYFRTALHIIVRSNKTSEC